MQRSEWDLNPKPPDYKSRVPPADVIIVVRAQSDAESFYKVYKAYYTESFLLRWILVSLNTIRVVYLSKYIILKPFILWPCTIRFSKGYRSHKTVHVQF